MGGSFQVIFNRKPRLRQGLFYADDHATDGDDEFSEKDFIMRKVPTTEDENRFLQTSKTRMSRTEELVLVVIGIIQELTAVGMLISHLRSF